MKSRLTDNSAPLVSILILNYNGQKFIENCIQSVLDTSYPNFEIILLDNASSDLSVHIIEKSFGDDKRLHFIKSLQNLGFSGGNNLAYNYASGDYIVFLNNDIIAEPGWLNALIDTMKDKSIGLAGSTILTIDGKKLRGAGGLWSDYLLFLYPVAWGKDSDYTFVPSFEVSFASGCSMIAEKKFLEKIGLFDPSIPYNYDDTLLSLKTWLAGKRVVSVSGSRIRHIGGASISKFWSAQSVSFSLYRAKVCLLFDTYKRFKDLAKALPVFFLSTLLESIVSFRYGDIAHISGNLKAFSWIIRNLKHVYKNRQEHWSRAKISPECLVSKFIRVNLKFPLCLVPSTLAYSVSRYGYLKYESSLTNLQN